ncbi:cation transporting ATPase C-terminal domain-containing protein [Streptomyces sp. NPDC047972]|uniref:cation transporting ATPase C-terminal domain-containing protein n=1 Tax=Streptomyces sp. NPDC047972 TaxID=3365493 RepID=UPI0037247883
MPHSRPSRPRTRILGGGAWQRLLVLAVVVTAASLGAAIAARTLGLAWQSVPFLALLAAQLGVALGLRSRLFTRKNPSCPCPSVLVSALLAAAALYVLFLRTLLETEPLGWGAWGRPWPAAPSGSWPHARSAPPSAGGARVESRGHRNYVEGVPARREPCARR